MVRPCERANQRYPQTPSACVYKLIYQLDSILPCAGGRGHYYNWEERSWIAYFQASEEEVEEKAQIVPRTIFSTQPV